MYVVGDRWFRNFQNPRQLGRGGGVAGDYGRNRVAGGVTQSTEDSFGVYRRPRSRIAFGLRRLFRVGGQGVGGFSSRPNGEIERHPVRRRLVLRPPPPGIERRRDDVAALDFSRLYECAALGAERARLVIENRRQSQL